MRVAYEAGPTGYGLARELAKRGVECVVAAPSKIPRASGDRVKTDRRDAEHLVRLLLAGKLHAVRVPGDEEEALRDLVRARDAVRMDLMRCRHRLSKLLLRHGIRFDDGQAWTQRHRRLACDGHAGVAGGAGDDARRPRRDRRARSSPRRARARDRRDAPSSPWTVQVGRLRCLRGVDTLSAVGLCAEIGDFERFARAEQLMSYVGLVPSESTTGQQRRLGSITKTGSGHARRLLVEASWHYRSRPSIGKALSDRQADQPPEAIAVAWSAQRRLHRTWTRLEARAKRRTIIAVAAARELAGFCLGDHPNRITTPPTHRLSRRLGRWRPGNARGTRELTMSNPPPQGWPRPILDSGSPRRTMVLRHTKPAYISLTARRAQPAGPPPTQPTTTPNHQRKCEKSTSPT